MAQFLLTFDGMVFLPLVTAAVVGARLTGSVRGTERQLSDHVIVAGLGNVGTRIVVRLYDDDLARRVQRTIGHTISRSVSYLAAPVFAAAMLDHQVLRTIGVGRHVLVIADVPIGADTPLIGRSVGDIHDPAAVRVIGLRRPGNREVGWAPRQDYPLAAQDRIFVLATRTGSARCCSARQISRASSPA